MARRFLVQWVSNFLAVLLVVQLMSPHIRLSPAQGSAEYWSTLAAFSAVLALLNAFLKPALYLVLAPITCLVMVATLGLARFVVSAFMFWLAGRFVDQVVVENLWWALLGALVTGLICTIGGAVLDRSPGGGS